MFKLRPGDDSLPDLTAEALHSLSHAYHALSDLTTNFRMPEPRVNVLPSMSPIPPSVGHTHARTGPTSSQPQAPESRTGSTTSGQTTTSVAGSAAGSGGVMDDSVETGIGVMTGGSGVTESGLMNGNGSLTGSVSTSVNTSTSGTENNGGRGRPSQVSV